MPLRLLQALCEQPGLLISRTELFGYIWPRQVVSDESLTKLIFRLRELLGKYSARIVTVRSRGVRLDATVQKIQRSSAIPRGAPRPNQIATPFQMSTADVNMSSRPNILIVDDAPDTVALLSTILKDTYQTRVATNGAAAIRAAIRAPKPDVILLDVSMPQMDGYEVCSSLKKNPETAEIPVLFLTSRTDEEDEAKGFESGAIDYITKPFSPQLVLARVATQVDLVRAREKLKAQNEHLESLVEQRTRELTRVQDATIVAMAALAETRDNETGNHIYRTQHYIQALARELQHHPRFHHELNDKSIELLFKSAPLHDIGKVGVPDALLRKPGRLTEEEFEIVKLHTVYGADAIRAVEKYLGESSDYLRFAREIAFSHQEHWDGTGYPEGLAGDEIPVSARLMTLADVYDALRCRRPYKPALSHTQALDIMWKGRATHFDPDVFDAFMRIESSFKEISEQFKDPESLGANPQTLSPLNDSVAQ